MAVASTTAITSTSNYSDNDNYKSSNKYYSDNDNYKSSSKYISNNKH
jgi:hypothetical protein